MLELMDIRPPAPRATPLASPDRRLVRELFEAMDEMLSNRDHYTFLHALRVAEISRRMGVFLGLPPPEVEILELGCLVHDIGKIAIPDDVLLKPGRFDWEDRQIMELHPLIGANLFARRLVDDGLIDIILSHHERLDGSGYPNGIGGNEIGPAVRIVSVADVYEALVAERPYKKPLTHKVAMGILGEEVTAGRLDGELVQVLAEITRSWSPLSLVRSLHASYQERLEAFRRKTYFREPLSDFYNYRYLLALDARRELTNGSDHYHIFMVDFMGLREFNRRFGYVRADELLDEVGRRLWEVTKEINGRMGMEAVMLVRKGADYLLYSACPDALLADLQQGVEAVLHRVGREWHLAARLVNRRYPAGFPLEQALNELFATAQP